MSGPDLNTPDGVDCYAVRRLNPVLGVVEVVETADARALSTDGVHWQLQVLAERPEHTWGSRNQGRARRQYFRCGAWHAESGLQGVPANPVLDVGAVSRAAERLTAALRQVQTALPFGLRDRYELWLLDRDGRPLALLGSSIAEHFLAQLTETRWRATLPTGETFVAPCLQARGIPAQDQGHAGLLEAAVQAGAGAPRRILRADDGSGDDLDDTGRRFAATAFPATGLADHGYDADTAALVADYLDWRAPYLLTLPDLPDALRRRLEPAAARQALEVAARHRLYPRILAPAVIEAARVEARLRRAAGS